MNTQRETPERREIKFRAWDTEAKRMVVVDILIFLADGTFHVLVGDPDSTDKKLESIYHPIVMQFTGLLDKEGKEIYESDIVKCYPSDMVGLVVWCKELGLFELKVDVDGEDGSVTIYSHQENGRNTRREIVGNLYQTPELLKP